jgi:Na+/H+ antiporter NhaC
MKMPTTSRKLAFILMIVTMWLGLAASAIPLARWNWIVSHGVRKFEIWWIAIVPMVGGFASITRSLRAHRKVSFGEWLWLGVPALASFILVWRTGIAYQALAAQPNTGAATEYVWYGCAFLTLVLVWTLGFPYEDLWGTEIGASSSPWVFLLSWVALGIGGIALGRGLHIARYFTSPADPTSALMLQVWMQDITAVVMMFFSVRLFLPLVVAVSKYKPESRNEQRAGGPAIR